MYLLFVCACQYSLNFCPSNIYFSFVIPINISSVCVAVIDVHSALCKAVMLILSAILFPIKSPKTFVLIWIFYFETALKSYVAADFFVLLRSFCPCSLLKNSPLFWKKIRKMNNLWNNFNLKPNFIYTSQWITKVRFIPSTISSSLEF